MMSAVDSDGAPGGASALFERGGGGGTGAFEARVRGSGGDSGRVFYTN